MPKLVIVVGGALSSFLVFGSGARALAGPCAPDAVRVGTVCVDRYEASVWQISPAKKALVRKVQDGKAKLADLEAAGAIQLNANDISGDEIIDYPSNFPREGNWTPIPGSNPPTPGVYALSIAGVPPSLASWFQAAQACALAGKRLLTNQEWQIAAAGTPESVADDGATTCSTVPDYILTGSRAKCVSSWGAYDMQGGVNEWVAEWGTTAKEENCTTWLGVYGPDFIDWLPTSGNDALCFGGLGGPGTFEKLPSAWLRGPGVLSIDARIAPIESPYGGGFRCGR